jgi:tetratricopeptide (TPR) repeat protein
MRIPVSNSAARFALLFFAVALAVTLAYSSIRNAIAVGYAGLNTRPALERATQLERGNPLNWLLLGHYWQFNLEEPDAARAIKAYRAALSLDPRSATAWLDLATAYELQGDAGAARDAFLRAKRVYPMSAEVSWRYGNFLLRAGELPQAFAEIRHAVSVDPKRAAEAFSRCWRVDPDIQAILDQVLPPVSSVYLDAIRELIADAQVNPAITVWNRLVSIHPQVQLIDAIPLTDMLLFARRPDDARRVWMEAASLSGMPPTGDPPGSVLWDGGFESGVTGGGFTWSFPPAASGVQIGLDTKEKHSGQRSLELGFDGKHNVNFSDVCHLAIVLPAASYRLSAWVRTQALTSDQGVRLRLEWTENSRASSLDTPEFHGTQPWTRVELPWTAPAGVRQVRVCVARNPSDVYASRIKGAAWVDDVALVPVPGVAATPASPASRKP